MTGRRVYRGATLLVVACLGLLVIAPAASAGTDLTYAENAAAWIMSNQDPNQGPMYGAIAIYPPPGPIGSSSDWLCVTPDRGNLAAQALAAVGAADGDAQGEFAAVQNWLNWYLGHLNWPDQYGVYGTVYDYTFVPDNPSQWKYTTAGDCGGPTTSQANAYYDSSDEYAASFLAAVQAFVQADPAAGDAWVRSNSYAVSAIGHVIEATKDSDGLMGAKPSYLGEFLEDNTENLYGLQAEAWLQQNVLNDSASASWWDGQAQALQTAIQDYLWQPCSSQGLYCWASDQPGTSWSSYNPGAYNQMVAVGQQGVPSGTAATLMSEFSSHYPNWTSSCDQAPGDSCLQNTDSWAAEAAIQERQTGQAQTWLTSAEAAWGGHSGGAWPWPWTTADMGILAMVATSLAS